MTEECAEAKNARAQLKDLVESGKLYASTGPTSEFDTVVWTDADVARLNTALAKMFGWKQDEIDRK